MIHRIFMYIMRASYYCISVLPLAIVIYAILMTFRVCITHKKLHFDKYNLAEFFLTSYVMTVLQITGIIGMQFHVSWFLNSFSFGLLQSLTLGSLMMMGLNMLLFMPIGILIPFVIRKCNLVKTLLIGFSLSTIIEILQMFSGRMSEMDDIIMNTLGTLIGFALYKIIFHFIKNKMK